MKLIFTLLLLLFTLFAFSQSPDGKEKKHDYYFYNDKGIEVSTKDSAEIIEMISEPDPGSKLYHVERFDRDGKIIFEGTSSKIHPALLQGQAIEFYPNGKRKITDTYKNNVLVGYITYYYNNGKTANIRDAKYAAHPTDVNSYIITAADTAGHIIVSEGNGYYKEWNDNMTKIVEEGLLKASKREGEWRGFSYVTKSRYTENYKDGILLSGVSTDSLGQTYPYKQLSERADYPGGMRELINFISKNVHYPEFSKGLGQGVVIVNVRFELDATGKAGSFRVASAPDKYMAQEAINVLLKMPHWIPAKHRGMPINYSFGVPVVFAHR